MSGRTVEEKREKKGRKKEACVSSLGAGAACESRVMSSKGRRGEMRVWRQWRSERKKERRTNGESSRNSGMRLSAKLARTARASSSSNRRTVVKCSCRCRCCYCCCRSFIYNTSLPPRLFMVTLLWEIISNYTDPLRFLYRKYLVFVSHGIIVTISY